MQVVRWGNSLAVRIPAELVERWELAEGMVLLLRAKGSRPALAERDGGFAETQAPYGPPASEEPQRATVGRWGNSLAVRLPQQLARSHGIAEGSDVMFGEETEVMTGGERVLDVERKRTREEALASFLASRGRFTGDVTDVVKSLREDLPARGPDVDD